MFQKELIERSRFGVDYPFKCHMCKKRIHQDVLKLWSHIAYINPSSPYGNKQSEFLLYIHKHCERRGMEKIISYHNETIKKLNSMVSQQMSQIHILERLGRQ